MFIRHIGFDKARVRSLSVNIFFVSLNRNFIQIRLPNQGGRLKYEGLVDVEEC